MILLDYRATILPKIKGNSKWINSQEEIDFDGFIQRLIGEIGYYNNKFRQEYGELVICCDGKSKKYWRRRIFPEYKNNRTYKQEDEIRDPEIRQRVKGLPNEVDKILKENFPFRVLKIIDAEADDIIATLVYANPLQKHIIISRDGDFKQLQRLDVQQMDPVSRKMIVSESPAEDLIEKLLAGDRKDGIPNIISPIESVVDPDMKQNRLTAKRKKELRAEKIKDWPEDIRKRFTQNARLIDLSKIPSDITDSILKEYRECEVVPEGVLLSRLIQLKYTELFEQVNNFKR